MRLELIPDLEIPKDPGASKFWYHEKLIGSSVLLICAGDSWTWGDSLPRTPVTYRTDHIYGNLLAQALTADFVNIARPGSSNIEFHDKVVDFLPRVIDRYQEIYVVLTLTETGRELWFDPVWTDQVKVTDNLNGFLKEYEKCMFLTLKKTISDFPKVKFLIARNFTYTYNENKDILSGNLLDKNWVDILEENQSIDPYPQNLRLLSQMGFNPLIKIFKKKGTYNTIKPEFFEIFLGMEEALAWLDESIYNFKSATRHPTEQGHRLWSDYLLSQINLKYK
jgi:hypothetical protein